MLNLLNYVSYLRKKDKRLAWNHFQLAYDSSNIFNILLSPYKQFAYPKLRIADIHCVHNLGCCIGK